jgi:hypothetical protein
MPSGKSVLPIAIMQNSPLYQAFYKNVKLLEYFYCQILVHVRKIKIPLRKSKYDQRNFPLANKRAREHISGKMARGTP